MIRFPFFESTSTKEFRLLYEAYYTPFCLYARRFINDMAACEDIVSDVFASLWDKRLVSAIEKENSLGYLKTCVRNSCLNYLKHQEYELSYSKLSQQNTPSYAASPDSIYTQNELYKMLYTTLAKLPPNYRLVFAKSFFEEKSHAEIAEELNLSIKSIHRYKQETMRLLKEEFREYLPIF